MRRAACRRVLLRLAALVPFLGAVPAHAATLCSVSTAGVAFGTYDIVSGAPTDVAGLIDLACSFTPSPGGGGTLVSLFMSAGSSGNFSARTMRAATDVLLYNLFTDPARTQIWGNGTAGTAYQSVRLTVGPGVGNSTRSAQYAIYGRIPARQTVATGIYSDTIVVTIEF
jgi:spore coat protein U-like protein